MDDDDFYAMSADAQTKYVQERRKKRKISAVSGKSGNEHLTKRQIQEITTASNSMAQKKMVMDSMEIN